MKPYRVQIEVTSKYTVEVHAEDKHDAVNQAYNMCLEEMEAQGSIDESEVTNVGSIEEIQ